MHPNWRIVALLTTILLSLLPLSNTVPYSIPPREGQICYISHNNLSALCYVQCFEDIVSILPPEINRLLIQHLVVHQTSSACHPEIGLEVFHEFISLSQLYYTGAVCPFSVLPNLTNIKHFTLMLSSEGSPSREEFIWTNSTRSELPHIAKITINEICCGLFQGTVVAPQLEYLQFRCSQVSSRVSGVEKSGENLVFVTPALKTLDYLESASAFPISSASDLPQLEVLFVTINVEFPDDRAITSRSLNLPSLRKLTYSRGMFGSVYGIDNNENENENDNYQCMELGATKLSQVIIIHPPSGATRCLSMWKCDACVPPKWNNSTDAQIVTVHVRSFSTTNLSSLLPDETLNTTHLAFNHVPLLQVDGEALRRFAHLRTLHVGEVSGLHSYNGLVTLVGNPFKALPRPQTLSFLRVALLKCGCAEYDAFAWLKAKNPNFEGEIQCVRVPETSIAEERIPVNQSMTVASFLDKLSGQCVATPVLQLVYNSTLNKFVLQPITQSPSAKRTTTTTTTTAEVAKTTMTTATTTTTELITSGVISGLFSATPTCLRGCEM
ncbi:hypothetical protein TcWFU_009999 [Taenia crassiceps]|uniref:Uncharacterized protein n=1 Tax=Taenia crassiceps TaxID=6207 RepID=A0ABR4Q4C7_9CEST